MTTPDFAAGLHAGQQARVNCPYCADGHRRKRTLSVRVDPDGLGGVFRCFRCSASGNWLPNGSAGRQFTAEEVKARKAEHARKHTDTAAKAAAMAQRLWAAATPAPADHPYLKRKKIGPGGLRERFGVLFAPVYVDGKLTSIQKISASGEKRFLTGGAVSGGCYQLGEVTAGKPLIICEGVATGHALYEATGWPVSAAFSAGNLEHVAPALRRSFPAVQIVIAADDDHTHADNPGITHAKKAAAAVGATVAVPAFGAGRPDGATDFNDLLVARGADAVREQLEQAAKAGRPITATPFVWRYPHEIPPRDWLFRQHYIRKFLVATAGPPAGAKSSITLIDYVSMVVGRDLLTGKELPNGPLRLWLYNTEDPREEIDRRIAAIGEHYGLGPGDFGDRLFIDTAREQDLVIAKNSDGHAVSVPRVVGELVDEIQRRKVDVFAADPLIHTHAVPENDNTGMGVVAKCWREVAERGDCCVELTHHIRKNGGQDTTADDMRGAGAILGSVRSLRLTTTMNKEDAKAFGIDEEERRFYVWVNPTGKPSLVPPASRRDWYYLRSVDLGNGTATRPGDQVGVATRWSPPDAFDGITVDDAKRVWMAIGRADPLKEARASSQAQGWVGRLVADVLGLDIDAPGVREQLGRMLQEWERCGAISKATIANPAKGRPVPVYVLASGGRPGPSDDDEIDL